MSQNLYLQAQLYLYELILNFLLYLIKLVRLSPLITSTTWQGFKSKVEQGATLGQAPPLLVNIRLRCNLLTATNTLAYYGEVLKFYATGSMFIKGHHDTQHNDIQRNDAQHNYTQHNRYISTLSINETQQNIFCAIMLYVVMLDVDILNVVMLSVVAPIKVVLYSLFKKCFQSLVTKSSNMAYNFTTLSDLQQLCTLVSQCVCHRNKFTPQSDIWQRIFAYPLCVLS